MLSQFTISKRKNTEAALDQQELYAIGLQHVQQLARRIWTDYNIHDPGITILELLCYALTDLGYRASFPVKDLLATESDNEKNMKKHFFTARQILPNRPLTHLDYRKLLIDLGGVKNAWLRPSKLTYYADTITGELLRKDTGQPGIEEVNVKGLHDVIIEYMDDVAGAQKAEIKKDVIALLHANRNLCEDFADISEVGIQSFNLCCELELDMDADVAKINAEMLFQIQQYLSPSVSKYTLSEMLERRKADGTAYTADEIFDGPVLDCGFIDDDELAEADLREEIRLSDVINILMDIKGVKTVRDAVLNPMTDCPDGTSIPPEDKWIVPVENRKKAMLCKERSRFVFYKRRMPVVPKGNEVDKYLEEFTAAAAEMDERKVQYDFDIPVGTYRNPGSYYSFQNHFPAVYGISEAGLRSTEDDARKAKAYQLKAYLLFFDQIMANYVKQLSKVRDLFSTDSALKRTYFYQVVDTFTEYKEIYEDSEKIVDNIEGGIEDKAVLIDRRNRFLDHLIARFAERFYDFANIMYSAFGFSPKNLIAYRCKFLNNYPVTSSERSLAYNSNCKEDGDLWNTDNVSGLEKRLAGLLGIHNNRRDLSMAVYDSNAEVFMVDGEKYRFRIREKDSDNIILRSSKKYDTAELAREEMGKAIRFGLLPSGYMRKKTEGEKYYFNVVDDTGQVLTRQDKYFGNEEEMNDAIDELMEYIRLNYSDEGMYVIENILLRPEKKTDPFLPICPAPDSKDCMHSDPYSYRLHIILPAYGSRFSDMDFRRFTEEVIREETPAHILPKICWISRDDMGSLEKRYRDWIYLKAGVEETQRKSKITTFINTLFAVKNVYPPEKLHVCDGGEKQKKFIVGRTAIGSMEDGKD